MTRKVRLSGGPCHGRIVDVAYGRKAVTVSWIDSIEQRHWGDDLQPHWVTVAVTEIDTYRMTDDPYVFEWVPTPTAVGDMEDIVKGRHDGTED